MDCRCVSTCFHAPFQFAQVEMPTIRKKPFYLNDAAGETSLSPGRAAPEQSEVQCQTN